MDAGGVLADEQPLGDLAVRQAGRDVLRGPPARGRVSPNRSASVRTSGAPRAPGRRHAAPRRPGPRRRRSSVRDRRASEVITPSSGRAPWATGPAGASRRAAPRRPADRRPPAGLPPAGHRARPPGTAGRRSPSRRPPRPRPRVRSAGARVRSASAACSAAYSPPQPACSPAAPGQAADPRDMPRRSARSAPTTSAGVRSARAARRDPRAARTPIACIWREEVREPVVAEQGQARFDRVDRLARAALQSECSAAASA